MKKDFDIAILVPVYNDWEAFSVLSDRILNTSRIPNASISIIVLNDGSSIQPDVDYRNNPSIEIINLNRNLGHQKAIAIGLAYISKGKNFDYVIVMDSDGEDKPEDIERLLLKSYNNNNKIVFAERTKRKEKFIFKLYYQLYKFIFVLLTGKSITFGNFSIIPWNSLAKLVNVSEIWNNYSAGVIKSKIPFLTEPIERGKRYAGSSKMDIDNLILHGLSAVAVFLDIVSIRLLRATFAIIFLILCSMLVVLGVRVFTDLPIPGWATYVMIGLSTVLMQALLICLVLGLIILHYRTQKLFIPAIDFRDYIMTRK